MAEVLQRLFRVPILLDTGLGEQNGLLELDPLAFLAKVMGILKSLKFHNFDFSKKYLHNISHSRKIVERISDSSLDKSLLPIFTFFNIFIGWVGIRVIKTRGKLGKRCIRSN